MVVACIEKPELSKPSTTFITVTLIFNELSFPDESVAVNVNTYMLFESLSVGSS